MILRKNGYLSTSILTVE